MLNKTRFIATTVFGMLLGCAALQADAKSNTSYYNKGSNSAATKADANSGYYDKGTNSSGTKSSGTKADTKSNAGYYDKGSNSSVTQADSTSGYYEPGANSSVAQTEVKTTTTTTSSTDKSSATVTPPAEKSQSIDMKKLSEAFGNFIGRNLQSPGLSFDLDGIITGIREGAAGKPSPLSEKEYEEMMAAVQEKAFKEMSETNLKAANDFMEKNVKESGIIEVVPGKLQYSVLKQGTGAAVESHSSPKIHYTGKYQDGTVFGTSEEMGGPITIPLDQTIPGFSKGIVGMKEGEKRRLYVHPDLGYGTSGQLPPNELLIFDIDVVKANSDEGKGKGNAGATGQLGDDLTDNDDDDDLFYEEDDIIEIPAPAKAQPASTQGNAAPTQAQTQPRK